MKRQDRAWPLASVCCSNPSQLKYHCLLAFTIPRKSLQAKATSFSQIVIPETRRLFHLFLRICSRVSVSTSSKATCVVEQVLDTRGIATLHYTFYLLVQEEEDEGDPCEKAFDSAIETALARAERYRPKKSEPWERWHELSSLGRVKVALQVHLGFSVKSNFDGAGRWGDEILTAHIAFSIPHAFSFRGSDVLEEQSAWKYVTYLTTRDKSLTFPRPRYVYVVRDTDLREPAIMYERMLPDWQAQCTPSNAIHFVDTLLNPSPSVARITRGDFLSDFPLRGDGEDLARTLANAYANSLGVRVEMERDYGISRDRPDYAQGHTYEDLRRVNLSRLALVENVACDRARWGQTSNPVQAARRLYDVSQRVGFEMHVAQMRGAFPENISPQARALMEYAELNLLGSHQPLPEIARRYSDLGRFCNREAWRWQHFADTYLVANHNVDTMMLIFYCMCDAYSYDLIHRVGLNVLLHTTEGGLGKSLLIKEIPQELRIRVDVVVYQTAKSQAVSSSLGEQGMRIFCMEELQESMITHRSTNDNEHARLYKTMLGNGGVMCANYLFINHETGEREPRSEISHWFGTYLAACNLDGLLSTKMDEPLIQRHIVLTLDQSERAKRAIEDKKDEAATKLKNPTFVAMRNRVTSAFKAEEFVYAEMRMLERERVVRPTSDDVASLMCRWISHALQEAGHPSCVRNRDKICALAATIAGLDAVDSVYFDRGGIASGTVYDIRNQQQVERRNWVTAAHMVHAIGLAPCLFLDIDERDVRLALCEEFEALTHRRFAFTNSDEDPGWIEFVDQRGLRGLANRLQRRLRISKEKRILLTADAIQYRLQLWLERQQTTSRHWTCDPGQIWPRTSESSTATTVAPIARLIHLGGTIQYIVQTGWIKRSNIPEASVQILLNTLRTFFSHRHQGGFCAPFGATRNGDLRMVKFKKADPDAPLLVVPSPGNESSRSFSGHIDEWGLYLHNRRLYLSSSPLKKLDATPPNSLGEGYFSGRSVTDLIPQVPLADSEAIALLLAADDDNDDDADAIVEADHHGHYPWDSWTSEEKGARFPKILETDSPIAAQKKHAKCRGEYKLISTYHAMEDLRIAKKLGEIPKEYWFGKRRTTTRRTTSHKRKWEKIAKGEEKGTDVEITKIMQ